MSPDRPQQSPQSAVASRRGQLFIVSAPSGAGKSTLCKAVRERLPDLHYSISYTTRAMRSDEVDGVHYHFISQADFREGIRQNRWAEWATVHDNLYGTAMADLNRTMAAGGDILLDIDVQGARQLVERFPDCVTVFILPPSIEILKQRLADRATDLKETIALRLQNAEKEIAAKDDYQHIIINEDLDKAVNELEEIIRQNRESRVQRYPDDKE
jgi:guanylate kinase